MPINQQVEKVNAALSRMSPQQLMTMLQDKNNPYLYLVTSRLAQLKEMQQPNPPPPQGTVTDHVMQAMMQPPQGIPAAMPPGMGMPPGMPPQGMPPQGMPPQGMPPQMPPQGIPAAMPPQMAQGAPQMPPEMPPQGMQAGGHVHDYGVASLPYESRYEHGGVVSFANRGAVEGDDEDQKEADRYGAMVEALFKLPRYGAEATIGAAKDIPMFIPRAIGAMGVESKDGEFYRDIDNPEFSLFPNLKAAREQLAAPIGDDYASMQYDPNQGRSPIKQESIAPVASNLFSATGPSKKDIDKVKEFETSLYKPGSSPGPISRPVAKRDLETPDQDEGFSATLADSPLDQARKLLEQYAKGSGSAGIGGGEIRSSIVPKKPGEIKYEPPYSQEEMDPSKIVAEKEEFNKLLKVNPKFYEEQISKYDKDFGDISAKAGSDRFMGLADAFLTMAQTPGRFGAGLAAGASKGISNLKSINEKIQERKDKIEESKRLLLAQQEAERRGDSKLAYEIKSRREDLVRGMAHEQEKDRSTREMEAYKTDISARDAELSRLSAAREAGLTRDQAARNAALSANMRLLTAEAANERADRQNILKYDTMARIAMGKGDTEFRKQLMLEMDKIPTARIEKQILATGRKPTPEMVNQIRLQMAKATLGSQLPSYDNPLAALLNRSSSMFAEEDYPQ